MTKRITAYVRRLIEWAGYDLVRLRPGDKAGDFPADFATHEIDIYRAVAPFTLTGPERVACLIRAVDYVVQNNIPGDFVECGVWKGGSMKAVAMALLRHAQSHHRLWLYDTYQGMSEPTAADVSNCGYSAEEDHKAEYLRVSKEAVRRAIEETGYELSRVEFVEGKVEETIPTRVPERIALLRLDTDWYESTRHELVHFYPRLSRGGILIIDDYGHWQGAQKAVDGYIRERGLRLYLSRIDFSARIAVKLDD
jgi:hypothetical protein